MRSARKDEPRLRQNRRWPRSRAKTRPETPRYRAVDQRAEFSMLGTILLVILILLLLGALPTWGYSSGWGYYPSGGLGLILLIVIILLVLGRI
jgi:hypothetical protein